jgi:hypothetical protein
MTAFWPPRKRDGEGTYKPFVNAEHAHVAPACAEWLGAASEDEVEYYILDLRSFHFPLTDQLFLIAGRRGYDVGRLYEQIRKTEHKVRSDMTLYRSSNSGTEHKPRSGMALYQSPSNSDHSA